MEPLFEVVGAAQAPVSPVVAVAVHAGHDLRPEIAARIALPDDVRLREEDPFTDRIAGAAARALVLHRSRFEVDLNRPRDQAVYERPSDAWGLAVWSRPLGEAVLERSRQLHDSFYVELGATLD